MGGRGEGRKGNGGWERIRIDVERSYCWAVMVVRANARAFIERGCSVIAQAQRLQGEGER
jgi:hypothetical protein